MKKWVVKTFKWKKGGFRFKSFLVTCMVSKILSSHAWYLKSYRVMVGMNEVGIMPPMDFDDVNTLQSMTRNLR